VGIGRSRGELVSNRLPDNSLAAKESFAERLASIFRSIAYKTNFPMARLVSVDVLL